MKKKILIAIDGYSSCGKSTMAQRLARQISYAYIDTGAMYRAVTLYALRQGLISDNGIDQKKLGKAFRTISILFRREADGSNATYLNGEKVEAEIRSMKVSQWVSAISAVKAVREEMVRLQREMGVTKGVVLDGRDIGTVVFPQAELKVFITADPDVRAERRWRELHAKGEMLTIEEVKQNLLERDHFDSTRTESPLRQANDAIILDNSHMTIDEQDAWLLDLFNSRTTSDEKDCH